MAQAEIEYDGEATTYTLPRRRGILLASVAAVIVSAVIALLFAQSDGTGYDLWTWLLPLATTVGVLPMALNAAFSQRVLVDAEGMEVQRWFGRRRLAWGSVVEAISYTNGQDLFLRVREERARILLSTRWYGWDLDDLRAIARRIDDLLERFPNVVRHAPLDRFPSWHSDEAGLKRLPRSR